MRIINRNLVTFLGLLILLGMVLFLTFQKLFPLIGHVTYYCQSLLVDAKMIPIPFYLSIIPFLFLSVILVISFLKFFVLNIKVHDLRIKLKKDAISDKNTNIFLSNLGLQNKAVLIKSKKRFAFCLGFRKPKIYFSTGLSSGLTMRELEAVLRHEQYHLERNDTFIMTVASVAYSLFPFFPIVGDLIKKYRIEREIDADKFSIAKVGDQNVLISALRKLIAFPTVEMVVVAAIADHDTLEPRIFSLLNKPYKKRRLNFKNLVLSMISFAILTAVFVLPVHARELHHENHDVIMLCADGNCKNSCSDPKNLEKFYSEIPEVNNKSLQSEQLFTPAH